MRWERAIQRGAGHARALAAWAAGRPMRPGRVKDGLKRAAGCLGVGLAGGLVVLSGACAGPGGAGAPILVRAGAPVPAPGVRSAAPAAVATAPPASSFDGVVADPTPAASPAPAGAPWLVYGDSLTRDAFADLAGWAEAFAPGAAPEVRNAGVPGMTSHQALLYLDETLAASPDARLVGLALGTNDVFSGAVTVEDFAARLRQIALRVRAAGRTPVLARIPYSPLEKMEGVPRFNAAIEDLERAMDLPAGPDLYGWTEDHPEALREDGIHMTAAGSAGIRATWAAALREAI